MQKVTIKVEGMMSDGCKSAVEKACKAQPGVQDVNVDLTAGTAAVTYDEAAVAAESLRAAIEEIGYDAAL